jgi:UDP-N-acetylmuramoyl-tripeptide--D-alanyl-D-alanine ligase
MNDFDKYAVIEMGAYYIGSIRNLCEFTPVQASIVTAVHLMHLDRFGGEEEVYIAKSELPKAVAPDGILVFNGDNPGARRMANELMREKTFIYGLEREKGHLDAYMFDIAFSKLGTSFSIHWDGKKYQGFTKMHGRGALSNIMASFTMACALGAKPETVLAVIRSVTPVSNRLEVKLYTNFIQINDAYNSNPIGFKYALEVLRDLPGSRRIMITPGMIELGEKQYAENARIAEAAAKVCDIVIVVNDVNREPLMEGLQKGGIPEHRRPYFATRDEALKYYESIRKDDDNLLLENDLPDVYECEEYF